LRDVNYDFTVLGIGEVCKAIICMEIVVLCPSESGVAGQLFDELSM